MLCISISLKFVHKDLVEKTWISLIAWRCTWDSATGWMVTQFIDANVCFRASAVLAHTTVAELKSFGYPTLAIRGCDTAAFFTGMVGVCEPGLIFYLFFF